MFFIMGLTMAVVQGGYVRRIPHGKEISEAICVSHLKEYLIRYTFYFVKKN